LRKRKELSIFGVLALLPAGTQISSAYRMMDSLISRGLAFQVPGVDPRRYIPTHWTNGRVNKHWLELQVGTNANRELIRKTSVQTIQVMIENHELYCPKDGSCHLVWSCGCDFAT
jgi:hypothetical protein